MFACTDLCSIGSHPVSSGSMGSVKGLISATLAISSAQYGMQWASTCLESCGLTVIHNTTGKRPSFLLFGWDCKSPSETAVLPPDGAQLAAVADYGQN